MKKQKDSSKDLINLDEIKNFIELKEYSKGQYLTIIDLQKKLAEKEQETNHLKTMLSHVVADKEGNSLPILKQYNLPAEELICIRQIDLLKKHSDIRQLSLEEVKALDILVKDLGLIRGFIKKPMKADKPKPDNINESELVLLAEYNSDESKTEN